MTTENVQKQTDDFLAKALKSYETLLPQMKDGEAKELAKDGFLIVKTEIERREQQKKSESQPIEKIEQLPKTPIRDAAAKVPQQTKDEIEAWAESLPVEPMTDEEWEAYQEWKKIPREEKAKQHKAFIAEMNAKHVKTVKAPAFVAPDELINVELEDSKGNKQVKTFSKAQVRALARKYFSNVHESWLGKEKKMGVGFKNLLAYVVAWKEFDNEMPQPSQILPYYDRYKQGEKASDAFKIAEELYNKIVEILEA